MTKQTKNDIIEHIQRINTLWLEGKTDELYNHFSNDVVFAAPGFHKYLKGKDLCIRSYKEFADQAEVINFQTENYNIDLYDDIAIGTYQYQLSYKMDGTSYEDSGHEIMSFKKINNNWLLIWRTQIPASNQ